MYMENPADVSVIDSQALLLQRRQYNAIILAGISIAVLLYPILSVLFLSKGVAPIFRVIISRLFIWATLPILNQYAVKVEGRKFLLWEEKKQKFVFYIAAIAVLFVSAFFAHAISLIPWRLGFHDNYTMLKFWDTLLKQNKPLLVFVGFTADITEELIMRGYVLPRLAMLFKSSWVPVVISSILFSLLHLSYWNLGESIFTFLFGLICALCYQKYRNIKVLMIFHFLYDLIIFV